jgi:hypothetical protein
MLGQPMILLYKSCQSVQHKRDKQSREFLSHELPELIAGTVKRIEHLGQALTYRSCPSFGGFAAPMERGGFPDGKTKAGICRA